MDERLANWLPLYNDTCPDPGLQAYVRLSGENRSVARGFIWIGMLLACEQAVHAFTLFARARAPLTVRLYTSPFKLPTGIALAWVVFTALSIFLVGLTFRSNAAVLMKTLHVGAEALFLILICMSFGFNIVAGLAALLVLVVLPMTITLPCTETITLAASSGLILDAVNFLVYAWYGLTQPDNNILWLYIGGLGWHALYLITFLGVMRWVELSDESRTAWRVAGMYFNIIAIEFFLVALRRSLLNTTTRRRPIKELLSIIDEPVVVWTKKGLQIGNAHMLTAENRTVRVFEPNYTIYSPSGLRYFFDPLYLLLGSVQCHTDGEDIIVRYALACAFGYIAPVKTSTRIDENVGIIIDWYIVRLWYWVCIVIVGAGVGTFS